MGFVFGRQLLTTTGNPLRVSSDGRPILKTAGLTLDWSTFAAVSGAPALTSIPEGITVPVGNKFARYGQVVTKITNAPTQVITETGVPTGGSFVLAGVNPLTNQLAQSNAIIQAATAAQVRAALAPIYGTDGAGNPNVTVTGAGGGAWTVTPAGLLAFTLVFPLMTLAVNSLTGGTAPAVTIAVGNAGTAPNNGEFGPYDPAATDGRQTLLAGECFILDTTILASGLVTGLPTGPTANVGALYGGRVFLDRIIQAGGGTHSLAAGPTRAELVAAFPMLQLVESD